MMEPTWDSQYDTEDMREMVLRLVNNPNDELLEASVEAELNRHAGSVANDFSLREENWLNVAVYNALGEPMVSVYNEDNAEEMPLAKYFETVVKTTNEGEGEDHFWKMVRWATASD